MRSRSPESFIEERVAQLEAISERRNVLLREMFHLIRRRQNVGSVLNFDEDEEGDLHVFLDRFNLKKNPETGSISHLFDSEMYTPSSRRTPQFVPRGGTWSKSNAKSPTSEPIPERRSLRGDARKSKWRNDSRALMEVDDDESPSRFSAGHTANQFAEEIESDDILALEPRDPPPTSRHHSASLPPHHRPDDDDERDELDLIGSTSVSPQSDTSFGPRNWSRTRSRSRSTIIIISDSPEPGEAVGGGDDDDADADGVAHPQDVDGKGDQENKGHESQETAHPSFEVVRGSGKTPSTVGEKLQEEERGPEILGGEEVTLANTPVSENDRMVIDINEVDPNQQLAAQAEPRMTREVPKPLEGGYAALNIGRPPITEDVIKDSTKPAPTLDAGESSDIVMEDVPTDAAVVIVQPPRPLPRVPFVPIPPVQMPLRSVLMPAPSSPMTALPEYEFHDESGPASPKQPQSPTQIPHHFSPHYTLPPLKILPVEFHRRGKLMKQQRRREKEREKNEKVFEKNDGKKENKDEWFPMGLNKWGATVRANPVWKKVSRAGKCLSTKEWNVAITELRLTRTIEHVEVLKDSGRWSFRQPKKQRGIGGLAKTHWDYLLDEMRWMRIDFREERKWKLALAYNLSTAVLEWHAAGSLAERVGKGICVLWKRPHVEEDDIDENSAEPPEDGMLVDPVPEDKKLNPLAIVDYGSDDEDEDEEQDKDQSIVDLLEPTTLVQDALDSVGHDNDQVQAASSQVIQLKTEDVDDALPLEAEQDDRNGDFMDVDLPQNTASEESNAKAEKLSPAPEIGLKPTSADPVLGSAVNSHLAVGDNETPASPSKSASKSKIYVPLRERIAYSDHLKLFLDTDDLELAQGFASLSTEENAMEIVPPAPDLSAIFPDLPPLGLLDVVPPLPEGRKKSERKSDKDDPNKRAEDTTYTKLTSMGKFMFCKPTLLGPLQPAKRWKRDEWCHLNEGAVTSEGDSPYIRIADDIASDLFEGNKPANSINITLMPMQPKDAHRRVASQVWTDRDDSILKAVAEKYPNNWPLISDSFNASGIIISSDRRTPWDCFERWSTRWGSGSTLKPQGIQEPSSAVSEAPPPPPAQMTTRGVKRLASASVAGTGGTSSGSGHENKKLRRHALMHETIRKASKRREQEKRANANQRKPSAIHDTHGPYSKMPKLSPAELSRMKADKEQRDNQEAMLKRRHEELARQQLLRDQGHRMSAPMQAQMMQSQQQQSGGAPRPTGIGIPTAQGVPQIRSQVNISQQQRIPTPMSTANTRLSPQQIMQVQAQARAMAAAQAQTTNLNGVGSSIAHMSPPYVSRAATSSPAQQSPPRSANTPSNAGNPPRPPSAQAQTTGPHVPGNAIPRPSVGHYFPVVASIQGTQYTQEQMEHLRLQRLQAQRQVGISQPQNGSYTAQP